jgi:mRNA-degrading endonuclease RelE of RelBE toxin-antitoxin system
VEIVLTEQFEQAYEKLSADEKKAVHKALVLLESNPRYPGLHTRKMEAVRDIWEARPSKRLRMTLKMEGETIFMRNVGEHDKVLKKP